MTIKPLLDIERMLEPLFDYALWRDPAEVAQYNSTELARQAIGKLIEKFPALRDLDNTEHILVVREGRFTLQHPIIERLRGDLFECHMHKLLSDQKTAPHDGRYYVSQDEWDGSPVFTLVA